MSGDEPPTFKTCSEVNADCPVEATPYADYLSTPANVLFLIAFLLPFLINVINGLRGRMWSYTFWLGLAFVFEIIGYLGRILVSRRPWSMFGFAVGFLFLLLGPTLMAAAISVTFKHIVVWYGPKWSVIKPSLLPWIFVGTDFLSILIQLIGGAATTSANTGEEDNESLRKIGEAVTVGGVSFQIANMVICAGLMLFYAWRRKRDLAKERRSPKSDWNPGYPTGHAAAAGYNADEMQQIPIGGPDQRFNGYNQQWQNPGYPTPGYQQQQAPVSRPENSRNGASLKEAKRAKLFCYALGASYGLIIIRCIYRYVLHHLFTHPIQ